MTTWTLLYTLLLTVWAFQWTPCIAVHVLRPREAKNRLRPAALAKNNGLALHSFQNAGHERLATVADRDLGLLVESGEPVDSFLNEWLATPLARLTHLSQNHVAFYVTNDTGLEQSSDGIMHHVAVQGDAFYALQMKVLCRARGAPHLSISDRKSHELLRPMLRLTKQDTFSYLSLLFRTRQQTSEITIGLLVDDARTEDECEIQGLKLTHFGRSRELEVKPMNSDTKATVSVSIVAFAKDDDNLVDVVNSFYPFVDKVQVFLYDYSVRPTYLLNDAKIAVARPTERTIGHTDGAFFFHDSDDADYRFHVTSSVRINAGYVTSVIARLQSYNNSVILGHDCSLIKQPLSDLFDTKQVRIPADSLGRDSFVHRLSEHALAFHRSAISFRRRDFEFPGMPGTWLAVLANQRRVPLVCGSKFGGLIKLGAVSGGLDVPANPVASAVSAAVVRSNWPMTAHLPTSMTDGRRLKAVLAVSSCNRLEYLRKCLDTFSKTRNSKYHWVVIVADDGSTDGTLDYLNDLKVRQEIHIIHGRGRGIASLSNDIFQLAVKIGFDIGFKVDDDIFFLKQGWDDLYVNAVKSTGMDHLIFFHHGYFRNLRRGYYSRCNCLDADGNIPEIARDSTKQLVAYVPHTKILGSFFTFTPRVIDTVGYLDDKTFSIRQGHRDFSLRACRAGFNNLSNPFDVSNSNDFIGMHYRDVQAGSGYVLSSSQSTPEYVWMMSDAEQTRRDATLADPRVRVEAAHVLSPPEGADRFAMLTSSSKRQAQAALHVRATMNATFDSAYIVRKGTQGDASLLHLLRNLNKLGLAAHVVVDDEAGESWPHRDVGSISGRAAVQVLTHALARGFERILLLSSDILLHRDAGSLFTSRYSEVPLDWRVLVLGAEQDTWADSEVRWMSPRLYSSMGSTLSAFAVGLHMSAFPYLLAELQSPVAFDTVAMQNMQRHFPNDCFVMLPNLAALGSIIHQCAVDKVDARCGQYRWNVTDYVH